MTFKKYRVSFEIFSQVTQESLLDGVMFQLAAAVPLGFHLVPRELETLRIEEVKTDVAHNK
jgi:hypothetical protein